MLHSCDICSHNSNFFCEKLKLFLLKVAQDLQPRHILPINSILRITNIFLAEGTEPKTRSWLTAVTIRKENRNFCIQNDNFGCHILFPFYLLTSDSESSTVGCDTKSWHSHTISLNILRRKNLMPVHKSDF